MSKIGRNDPCPCGSGKKYKKCCLAKDEEHERQMTVVESALPPSVRDALDRDDEFYQDKDSGESGDDEEFDDDDDPDAMGREETTGGPPFDLWSVEEAEAYTTEEIVAKLRSFGIEFDEATFRSDAARFKCAEALSDHWLEEFDVTAEGRDEDFPWFAAMVLWDRLCPEIPYVEQLDSRIDAGYSLRGEERRAEACDVWMSVWETIVHHFAAGHPSVEDLEESLPFTNPLCEWCEDLEMELGSVGDKIPSYHEKRIAFCSEYAEVFPDTSGEALLYIRKAAAASWIGIGNRERGDQEFQKLTTEHPDWLEGYIGWGEAYASGPNADLARARGIYRMAQGKGLEDKARRLASRLKDLEKAREERRE